MSEARKLYPVESSSMAKPKKLDSEPTGISRQDKDSMMVLINTLSVSRTPEERVWLARQIEQTAIEDGYLRSEYRKHPRLVNPPRWRDS